MFCKIARLKLQLKDPYFVTPLIKSLLDECCRLRKHGHTEQADAIAVPINHLISAKRSKHLTRLAEASPKEFCAAVRKSTGTNQASSIVSHLLADPDLISHHVFANLSTKKAKAFPYSILNVGPGAGPGVQAVSLQMTVKSSTRR